MCRDFSRTTWPDIGEPSRSTSLTNGDSGRVEDGPSARPSSGSPESSRMLRACSCASTVPSIRLGPSPQVDSESAALAIVAPLSNLVDVTPLALFANLFLEFKGLEGAAAKMFGAYDEFLSILNDDDKRQHLDRLSQPDVATDEMYHGLGYWGTTSSLHSTPSSSTRKAAPNSMS